ncbi:M23 family metallopeptidase [Paenibacillus sp. NEAU-GSW1]|uniref:M23 family metallopeptidase n=1 Tax=Paenibacillus sp. NEAU-GSW1 TaxID=2682486 RepID=UPI0012E31DD3|nr:M23 family metallopeptidase [Paenibacillus sp. NEAU-GSW1]MUT67472.1 peptidoglycan DD-metalloendopeptidase family protein [Paenibacillus sp. NEAU-GSW1]
MSDFKPMDRIRKTWNQTAQFFRQVRPQQTGKILQQSSSESSQAPWWRTKPVMITAAILFILAAAGIGGTKYVQANTVDYYNVYMNGSMVGSVSDPKEVDDLIAQETKEVKDANPEYNMMLDSGEISYTSESAFKAEPETEATLAKLEGMFTSHAVGVELKVDGKVIGVVKNQETADAILTRVQSKYAPQLASSKKKGEVTALSYSAAAKSSDSKSEAKNGTVLKDVQFVEVVKTNDVSIQPDQIQNADDIYKQLVQGSVQPTKYTVQEGDCIGCIAEKFDISPQVIYDNNRWIDEDKIKAGDVLDLTVLQPELTVKTIESLTETVAIAPPVEIQKNADMRAGESKVIREGQSGKKVVTYRVVKQNGYLVSEELISSEVVTEAIPEIIMKGTKVILGEGSGSFAMPVSGWSLSSKYGQRWGRSHKGIDITGNKTIMAADNGVIEFVGTKSGYGNVVIIDHKNGYKTLYGHLSSYSVKKGQIVEKGDKIGIMGSTGRSTGVHLHFEIHKNGVIQNPLKYL